MENLRNISQNPQYLESLIFTLNYHQQDRSTGVEQGGYKVEKLREIIDQITGVTKFETLSEKRLLLKRHIKNIIYSKEAIEVIVNYGDKGKEFRPDSRSQAAFFCRHSKKCRNPLEGDQKSQAGTSGQFDDEKDWS